MLAEGDMIMERGKLVHEQKCTRGALLLAIEGGSFAQCLLEPFIPDASAHLSRADAGLGMPAWMPGR